MSLVDSGLNQLDDGLNLGTGTAGPVTIGTTALNQNLTVNGTATVNRLLLSPPPGDPSPFITARAIPTTQGGTTESTELILFHSDDPSNGSGPDYITLRAPAIRLQTYNSSVNANIDNAATSNTRLNIDPTGAITAFGAVTIGVAAASAVGTTPAVTEALQPLTVNGPVTANKGLTVSGGGTLSFGSSQRQMLNLYGTVYGLGIQPGTLYNRTDDSYAWFRKGTHNDTKFDAGTGGTTLMTLNADGLNVNGLLTATTLTLGTGSVSATRIVDSLPAAAATDENTSLPTAKAIRDHVSSVASPKITSSTNIEANTIKANALLTASAGLAISGTISTSTTNPKEYLTVGGPMTVSGLITANNGLTVTGAGVTIGATRALQPLTVNGLLTATTLTLGTGTVSATKIIDSLPATPATDENTTLPTARAIRAHVSSVASASITASTNIEANMIKANALLTATNGLTVSGGTTTVGAVNAASASISGEFSATTVKIGAQSITATSIVASINSMTPMTAIPTTQAVTSFVNQAIPLGAILMWSGTGAPPPGWALCDGSNNTPDLRDKFVLGKGARALGTTGGSESVILGINHLPSHTHNASLGNAGNHSHATTTGNQTKGSIPFYGTIGTENLLGTNSQSQTGAVGDHTHSVTVNNTGGGTAHDNMPPFYVLAYIIRVS